MAQERKYAKKHPIHFRKLSKNGRKPKEEPHRRHFRSPTKYFIVRVTGRRKKEPEKQEEK